MTVANSSLSQQYILDIELEGRLTFPQEIQQILNLESGDRLILTLEDSGKLQLVSLKQQVKKLRGFLKDKSPDRNLVDELIQECRQEYLSE
ncbi:MULTISPECIES: AbrB/MazE/SpoVT family DNA-binding domain-containing protein [unclassified Microcystis]|jgi:bifunctional DNA-binding transcriptional regulator/antitoxin component of YhaV-PrlF toxin-antitoxin module|uniref:AbrB/MazE/SpoVT family DNA-binding domain-containing protein n=1 Tax=unclassified Microcystis TaxID=2643300 RepID=UPI001193E456|nr:MULTISPECIES: AbrB/MazE/SpoVT family DNA-binding domain-containing protein [unclassified Microcystis]MCA2927705.1 AbrB/MazE/SpoVT family DNA-binding domain-containing protein [Microcystis sp. M020S1]MCA2937471.1 AbrB/MazE/SpoVT family DNA-binding domain-containing protein [Microcystis sp. M015S1]NCR57196.1 AbrB/MazE/SpoVT family DNA-binding domain-containing protein [Microcystis aeruginosa LL13-06]MCA2621539.1 AbrB/MazE/SpoVT family DNA-binding domain-containing protein [Microcystis sp. M099